MSERGRSQRPSGRPSLGVISLRPSAALAALDGPLADEPQLLDALAAGLASGEVPEDAFERLHEAAIREDRMASLALAYDRLLRDGGRVRRVPREKQARLLLRAAAYFVDILEDRDGAIPFAGKAFELCPEDDAVFRRLEGLLVGAQDGLRLARACTLRAEHEKDPAVQQELLLRAAELLEAFSDGARELIDVHRRILELDPRNAASLESLERLYSERRRFRDLARLWEQRLGAAGLLTEAEADAVRLRLVALYRGELRDPQHAAIHVEALLHREPVADAALQAAEALLDHKSLAGTLAPALGEVYRRHGRSKDEATTLELELKVARPPRLAHVQRRLAVLRQDVLGDPAGALELLELLMAQDPGDDDMRRRYLAVSATFRRQTDAARLLTRAVGALKDPTLRARLRLEIADLYLEQGDARRARAALQPVVESEGDDAARLAAARQLVGLHDPARDDRLAAAALEAVAKLDPDPSARVTAARRLAELREADGSDPAGAIAAWRELLDTPEADVALDRLEALYGRTGEVEGLIEVLEHREARAKDRDVARRLAFRAAELRTDKLRDPGRALDAWRALLRRYGGSRDVHARMLPLLEAAGSWTELCKVLEQDASLASREEKPELFSRIGDVRKQHLADDAGALAAFEAALRLDARCAARGQVEAMLVGGGDQRLAAAAVLEPIYRAEGDTSGLLRVLEARAEILERGEQRLAALDQAVTVAVDAGEGERALTLCARALADAAAAEPASLPQWLQRFGRLSATGADPSRAAKVLVAALGEEIPVVAELERALEGVSGQERGPALLVLSAVLVACGQPARALRLYGELLDAPGLDGGTLARIESLCDAEQDADTLRRVLTRRAEMAADDAERAAVLERLGDLEAANGEEPAAVQAWQAALALHPGGDAAPALRLCEKIIVACPGDREAAVRLIDVRAERGEWQQVAKVFEVQLRAVGGSEETAELLLALEERARAGGAELDLAAMVESALGQMTPGPARRRLLALEARALAGIPERHEDVASIYRELVEGHGDAEDVRAFEEFLAGSPDTAARRAERRWLFAWRVEHGEAAALAAWARAEEEELGDPEAAIRLYERVLEDDPDHLEALRALGRLRLARGDAEGLRRALEALRERASGSGRIPIDLQLAALLLDQLDDPGGAVGVLRSVLEARPEHEEAQELLRQALEDARSRVAAAEVLERAASRAGGAEASAATYRTLLAATADVDDARKERARWYERLVALTEDPQAALESALRGVEELPDTRTLWDAAEGLARRLKQPGVVIEAYGRALARGLHAELAEALGRRLVELHEEWFEEPEVVQGWLRRILELAPGARWALDRIKLSLNAEGRWEELFQLYDGAIAVASDPAELQDLVDEAALAAKDLADDPDRAIVYLERLHGLRPADARVESTLERLYERTGRKRALIELLEARLPGLGDGELQRARARIAGLRADVGEIGPAFELAFEMLQRDAEDPSAHAILEKVIELPESGNSDVPPSRKKGRGKGKGRKPKGARTKSLRQKAAELLRERYRKSGRTADVVRMLEIESEFASSPGERVKRLQEIVSLRRTVLEDREGALRCLANIVRLAPTPEHREQLRRLAEEMELAGAYADVLVEVAESSAGSGGSLAIELLQEAAEVHDRVGQDPPRAIALYRRALELAGDADPAALELTRRLERLLRAQGSAGERCDALERLAGLEPDPAARAAALSEAARLASEELGDVERAARAWRRRLEDDDRDIEALNGLDEVLTRSGRFRELATVLEARARLVGREDARRDRARLARLQAEELGDPATATRTWRAIREEHGDDESFEALVALLEAQELWEELASLLLEVADAASGREQRAELYCMLGELHRERTKDLPAALEAYMKAGDWKRATDVAAAAGPAAEELAGRLLEHATEALSVPNDGSPGRAASWAIRFLVERRLEEGQHAEAVELQLRGAALPLEPAIRRQLLADAAGTSAHRLGDTERAIELFGRLFAEEPGDAIARACAGDYARLLEASARWEPLARLWEVQAYRRSADGERTAAAALWARAAELWEIKLGAVDRAVAVHRQGAALGGEASLEALARLYAARNDGRAASVALEWLCAQSAPDVLPERTLRLAETYLRLGERRRARARLEHAAAAGVGDEAVRRRLAELYTAEEDWEALARLRVAEAEQTEDDGLRVAWLREAADLHLRRLGDAARAVPLLELAIEGDPENVLLHLELGEALSSAGRHDDALRVLRARLKDYGDRRPKARALVHLHLGRALFAGGRRDEAMGELETATRIDPAHPVILHQLARLALKEGDFARADRTYRSLLLVLRRPAEGTESGPSRAEVYLDLSEVAKLRGDTDRAAELVESAFEAALDSEADSLRLEGALAAAGRRDLLLRAVERRLDAAPAPSSAARALADLVQLHTGPEGIAGDVAPRIAARAAEIDRELERTGVADETAFAALCRVYERLGDRAGEAHALARRVDAMLRAGLAILDPSPIYRLARMRLLEEQDLDTGVELLRRALQVAPDLESAGAMLEAAVRQAPAAHAELLKLYEEVARNSGDERSVAEAIRLATAAGFADAFRVQEGVEIALALGDRELAESLLLPLREREGPERVASLLREIADREPCAPVITELLSEHLEGAGRFDELESHLAGWLEKARQEKEAGAVEVLSLKLGRLLEHRQRAAEALAVYRAALEWNGDSRRLLRRVVALLDGSDAGALSDAIEALLRVEEPDSTVDAAERLVELRERQEDRDAIDRALAAAVTANPRHTGLRERLLRRAEAHGTEAAAVAVLRGALERAPDDRSLIEALVGVCESGGCREEGVQVLTAALAAAPGDAALLASRARLLSALARHDAAVADLEGAHAAAGGYLEELVTALEQAAQLGEDRAAESHLLRLASLLESQGRGAAAREYLAALVRRNPRHPEALWRLAALAEAGGDWEAASSAYRHLITLEEGDGLVRAALRMAGACEQRGRPADARDALERALRAVPGNAELRQRLRDVYVQTGADRELASLILEEAATEADASARAELLQRAAELLLSKAGEGPRAAEILEEALALRPDSIECAVLLARVRASAGRSAEALEALEGVVAANRGRRSKELSQIYREVSSIHLEAGDLSDALEALSRAFDMDMRNAELAMQLGHLALDLDDEQMASRAFRAVTMMKTRTKSSSQGATPASKAVAYYHLSRIARAQGDVRRARLMASKAVSEDPEHDAAQTLLKELRAG